jgi:lipase chaperone LimK
MSVKFSNNKMIWMSLFIAFILLSLIYWIFKPQSQNQTHESDTESHQVITANEFSNDESGQLKNKLPTLANSLQGTEIDCPIQVDSNGKLILTVGIRSCFDYFFSTLGEKTEDELMADIRQYLNNSLPETASTYASYLLNQYVAYMRALRDLKPSGNFKSDDIEALQKITDQMSKVQQQFFTAAEIKAFFGNEKNLNQFKLDQLKIHANKNLTSEQKATEIAKLIDQLPPTLGDGVRVSMQFAELQQLTQEIKQKGGSAQELRDIRENLLGADAADRLEKVDQEEADWQKQVNTYLSARDQILKSEANEASKQQAINGLRANTFSSKEDLLRAQSFEIMHDQKQ